MKISIEQSGHPAYLPNVYAGTKTLTPPTRRIADPHGWNDDELAALLGEANYEKYEAGKFTFDVTKGHYDLITGLRAPKNNHELRILASLK